jgi:hypothetical protein
VPVAHFVEIPARRRPEAAESEPEQGPALHHRHELGPSFRAPGQRLVAAEAGTDAGQIRAAKKWSRGAEGDEEKNHRYDDRQRHDPLRPPQPSHPQQREKPNRDGAQRGRRVGVFGPPEQEQGDCQH